MSHAFAELVVGGVLIAPFVGYAVVSMVILLLLRPLLVVSHFERVFSNPALALLCIFLLVLAAAMLIF